MATSHGSKAVLRCGTVAAPEVMTDISEFANSVGATFNRDTAETTTFRLGSKQYIPGLKDATVPYEGPYDTEADDVMWPLYEDGVLVPFEYLPAGEGTGNRRYTGIFFVTSYEVASEVSDANSMSGEFQVTGDVAREILV